MPTLDWIKVEGYVWCDNHGGIHSRTTDPYDVKIRGDDCTPDVWRPVYVLGDPGETF